MRILASVGRGKGWAQRKIKTSLFPLDTTTLPASSSPCPVLVFDRRMLRMITRVSSMDPRDTRDDVGYSIQNLKIDSLNIYSEINKPRTTAV